MRVRGAELHAAAVAFEIASHDGSLGGADAGSGSIPSAAARTARAACSARASRPCCRRLRPSWRLALVARMMAHPGLDAQALSTPLFWTNPGKRLLLWQPAEPEAMCELPPCLPSAGDRILWPVIELWALGPMDWIGSAPARGCWYVLGAWRRSKRTRWPCASAIDPSLRRGAENPVLVVVLAASLITSVALRASARLQQMYPKMGDF